ncbi:hypothetical protein GGD83_002677 [Rhodoblastus sphagnicola]|nr:hypothetical protein [Rhodoblastus sphagnicola]MBB4198868.1 hypothetical protein [Rhodoblastus sphagnicola]
MDLKAAPERTLILACRWSRDPRTGRLEAQWLREAPVKREEVIRRFAPAG